MYGTLELRHDLRMGSKLNSKYWGKS